MSIGNAVWIGDNVTILAGACIANGAVIGANSVVTKHILPYTIVAGAPAKKLDVRFTDDVIELIEKSKWWYWTNEEMVEYKDVFNGEFGQDICSVLNNRLKKEG